MTEYNPNTALKIDLFKFLVGQGLTGLKTEALQESILADLEVTWPKDAVIEEGPQITWQPFDNSYIYGQTATDDGAYKIVKRWNVQPDTIQRVLYWRENRNQGYVTLGAFDSIAEAQEFARGHETA